MTKRKKFQKRVRARMEETGEGYTEAMASVDGSAQEDVVLPKKFGAQASTLIGDDQESSPWAWEDGVVEFDPEDSPGRPHVLTEEERDQMERIWKTAPNVDHLFGIGDQPPIPELPLTHISLRGDVDSRHIIKALNKAMRDPAPSVGVLKALEKENASLRQKLRDAGLDPDA